MNNYNLIAMIPARLSSKRIIKKNIRYLYDKPLIQYPIDLALQSEAFESIWINTESAALGEMAKKLGVNFHCRPIDLSYDTATNKDFTYEFLKKHNCDYVVMINTTSPLLRLKTLKKFIDYLQNNNHDTIMSVISIKAESFYKKEPINFDVKETKINSQMLEPIDIIMWALTAWKRESFIRLHEEGKSPVFGGSLGLFAIPKDESVDLDTEEDWNIAEGMLIARQKLETLGKRYMEI